MATASFTLQSTVTGVSEGGTKPGANLTWTNSSAVFGIFQTTLTTNGITGATTVVPATTGVSQILIVPPSTNTVLMRMGASTADTTAHMSLHPSHPTMVSVTSLSTVVLWTTGSSVVSGLRILQF